MERKKKETDTVTEAETVTERQRDRNRERKGQRERYRKKIKERKRATIYVSFLANFVGATKCLNFSTSLQNNDVSRRIEISCFTFSVCFLFLFIYNYRGGVKLTDSPGFSIPSIAGKNHL